MRARAGLERTRARGPYDPPPVRAPLLPVPLTLLALLAAAGCREQGSGGTLLVDRTEASGIDFRHRSGAGGERRLPEIMGGGCALFDADGDGDLDAYLTQGDGPNRLFENLGGGRFADATESSGLGDTGRGMGVAVGDVEGDGDLDVYVANFGPDRLYRNEGDGTFADVTAAAGVDVPGWSTSVSFFDPDGDGQLDLWVVRYVRDDGFKRCTDASGRPDYCNPKALPPERDVFLANRTDRANRGGWSFEDASEAAGLFGVAPAAGLGVVSFDADRDGRQDVVVANDGYANHVWLYQGGGTFREAAAELGAAYDANGAAEAGMGIVAADLAGRGRLDLFLTHLSGETNTLYACGPAGFDDLSAQSGLGGPSVPHTGFGVAAFDADLDGDLDLAVANGRVSRADPDPRSGAGPPWDEYAQPNSFYENRGGSFEARPGAWSDGRVEISRGLACGDVDGDGDLDLLMAQVEGPARLWLGEAQRAGRWLAVRALDAERDALGAEVRLESARGEQVRLVTAGSSYLSSGSPLAHFGIPPGSEPELVRVRWPDGSEEVFAPGELDRVRVVRRGEGER